MAYKLIVENYGKIEKAELEISPLTLFVGDNNSGKSYLLSLIWTLFSGQGENIICKGMKGLLEQKFSKLYSDLKNLLINQNLENEEFVVVNEEIIISIINELLLMNKDELVKSIFNYEGMSIGRIEVKNKSNRHYVIKKEKEDEEAIQISVYIDDVRRIGFQFLKWMYSNEMEEPVTRLVELIVDRFLRNDFPRNATYYLPATRTGFMLAKNTINQVGRKKAFDNIVELDDETKNIEVSPFPKPIIHFLDSMDNLNLEVNDKNYKSHIELLDWINHNMTNGDVKCIDNNSGNIQYVPDGMKNGIPLRATSGVVTELAPLILLLKYARFLQEICYEEPEMCLHSQLQYQMAKLIIRMVNSGINIVASTHSDIILQHINNMSQLYKVVDDKERLESLGLKNEDLINVDKISVYQFHEENGKTNIDRIYPENNVFKIPTFSNALKSILDQTLEVSDIVYGEEE